jgi:hypothetical protein
MATIKLLQRNELAQITSYRWETRWIGAGPRRAVLQRVSPSEWRVRAFMSGGINSSGYWNLVAPGERFSILTGDKKFPTRRDAIDYINRFLSLH